MKWEYLFTTIKGHRSEVTKKLKRYWDEGWELVSMKQVPAPETDQSWPGPIERYEILAKRRYETEA